MSDSTSTTKSPESRRPMSPHLQIYRPMLTMMMSIVHRITGAGLYFGTLLLAWWLIAAATDAKSYMFINDLLTSFVGRIILLGYTWALFHHMMGGIRHFIWDTGRGLDHPEREYLAQASLIASIGLTLFVWILAYLLR
jgi:succinate dehydrogenase / fumarate reductase cytochrome b subunit